MNNNYELNQQLILYYYCCCWWLLLLFAFNIWPLRKKILIECKQLLEKKRKEKKRGKNNRIKTGCKQRFDPGYTKKTG